MHRAGAGTSMLWRFVPADVQETTGLALFRRESEPRNVFLKAKP